jgi:hypothetical protein
MSLLFNEPATCFVEVDASQLHMCRAIYILLDIYGFIHAKILF